MGRIDRFNPQDGQDQDGIRFGPTAPPPPPELLVGPPLQVKGLTGADLDEMLAQREQQLHHELCRHFRERVSEAWTAGHQEGRQEGEDAQIRSHEASLRDFADSLGSSLEACAKRLEQLSEVTRRPTQAQREHQAMARVALERARSLLAQVTA
jgi:hypothetical protein